MRVVQIVLPGASAFERHMQRLDAAILAREHEVTMLDAGTTPAPGAADLAHVYGPAKLPVNFFRKFSVPYLSNGEMVSSRLPFRRPREPKRVVSPVKDNAGRTYVPEAVDDAYFEARGERASDGTYVLGVHAGARPDVMRMLELTRARVERTRGDVRWRIFDDVPSPADLQTVDVWLDPATSERDFDGGVAEALAAGKRSVASRTAINVQRLEKGRCGWLVPPGDPNEMTHAILAALFKPEVAEPRVAAARQTASKFRARQRERVLVPLYESLLR